MELDHFDFHGLKISRFSLSEFNEYIRYKIRTNSKSIIYGYSLGSIIYAKKIPEILWGNRAEVSLIDGQWLYYLIKLSQFKVRKVLSIPDSISKILDIANQEGFTIMLYGSDIETNLKASANITIHYPKTKVFEGIDGYSRTIEESIELINYNKPNVLLIGISSPTKEIIAFKHKDEMSVNIIVPCGGMIDVLAGKTKQTNKVLKRLGLASLVRLIQEPKRLYKRYLFFYVNLFFNFLPLYFFCTLFKKKHFTILRCLILRKMNYSHDKINADKFIPYYDEGGDSFIRNIKIASQNRNIGIFLYLFFKLKLSFLQTLAMHCPLNGIRILLHRWRGVHIGRNVYIGKKVFIDNLYPNYIYLDDNSVLNAESMIIAHFNPAKRFSNIFEAKVSPVIIKNGALVGIRAIIMPGVIIGECAVITAGSVVMNNIAPFTLVQGNPAKKILNFEHLMNSQKIINRNKNGN